jgi:hypothetical protein
LFSITACTSPAASSRLDRRDVRHPRQLFQILGKLRHLQPFRRSAKRAKNADRHADGDAGRERRQDIAPACLLSADGRRPDGGDQTAGEHTEYGTKKDGALQRSTPTVLAAAGGAVAGVAGQHPLAAAANDRLEHLAVGLRRRRRIGIGASGTQGSIGCPSNPPRQFAALPV